MRHVHALIIASGLCVPSLALAAAPVEQGHRPVTSQVATSQHAAPTVTSESRAVAQADRTRYAEKDAQAGEAKDYRGGDTLVIGASAATAILAVILLIVLL